MIRDILTDDNPVLRITSEPVKADENVGELIQDMKDTMADANGIGLSAVQIGVLKRVIVIQLPEMNEPLVMINPNLTRFDEAIVFNMGCLSLPGQQIDKRTFNKIKMVYKDEDFKEHKLNADGLLAVCIQHEIDHLYGILMTDGGADV